MKLSLTAMCRVIASILAVAGFLFAGDGGTKAASGPNASTVEITWPIMNHGRVTGMGVGSGVYIGNGLIVTARHVVRDTTGTMMVTDQFGERAVAATKWISKTTDVAVIKLNSALPSLPASALDKRRPVKGEAIEVVGCPLGRPFVHTTGVVTSAPENPFSDWRDAIEISAKGLPGNSGGPVYDRDGKVLGIFVGATLDENKRPIAYIMISAREVAGV